MRIGPALRSSVPLLMALVIASLGTTAAFAEKLDKIKLSVDFRLYGPNAPFVLAPKGGFFRNAGIDAVADGSSGAGDAVSRVASGIYDMAYADVSTLEQFWAQNSGVAPKLMVILDRTPQSIVSLKKARIAKISDLVGRTIGTVDRQKLERGSKIVAEGFSLPRMPTVSDLRRQVPAV